MPAIFVIALLALAAQLAAAHYTFPYLLFNGSTSTEFEFVRITANHYVRLWRLCVSSIYVPD
jgi:hypothetical protein